MPTKTYPNLTTFQPDSGGLVGVTGLVPPPQPGDSAAGKALLADGTWGTVSGGSTTTNIYVSGVPGQDGEDGTGSPGPPGNDGAAGAAGAAGATGAQGAPGISGQDGDDGFPGIPGANGAAGATGPQGAQGFPGYDGDDGVQGNPGPAGNDGAAGATGPAGAAGFLGPMGFPGDDGNDSYIPGPIGATGAAGVGGGLTYTTFTKDLGAARRSGTFDVTGLSGLTAAKVVNIVQTAGQITSKGNARDEPEMDQIQATGYVVDAATIRAYWCAPSVVVGTYEFAYVVSG